MSEVSDLIKAVQESRTGSAAVFSGHSSLESAPTMSAPAVIINNPAPPSAEAPARAMNPMQSWTQGGARSPASALLAGGATFLLYGYVDQRYRNLQAEAIQKIIAAVGYEKFALKSKDNNPWTSPELITEARLVNSSIPEKDPAEISWLFGLNRSTVIPLTALALAYSFRNTEANVALGSSAVGGLLGLAGTMIRDVAPTP